jgi:hypothetical protein
MTTLTAGALSGESRAQTSSAFECSATPNTVLNLTGGTLAHGVTTYTSTNGVVVTSSAVNYNHIPNYYLGYLFNNSYTTARSSYWLTSANTTVTITLPRQTPIDRVRVLSVPAPSTDAHRQTNYRIYADQAGTLVDITNGFVQASTDTAASWREHGVLGRGILTTNRIQIVTQIVASYSAINEVQLVLQTCPTLTPCPVNGTDVTLSDCELTPEPRSFTGTLTIDGPIVAPSAPWWADISADNIIVTGNGVINLSGKGDAGTAFGFNYGAGHAGLGGENSGSVYGSVTDPSTVGGGFFYSPGGGHVTLRATTGSLVMDGTINVDAAPHTGTCINHGGAGGSVRLVAAQAVGGSGWVYARGAAACSSTQRAGGGGRISVVGGSELPGSTLLQSLRAQGGTGTLAGGAGSVYAKIGGVGTLVFNNFGINGAASPFPDSYLSALGTSWHLDVEGGAVVDRWGVGEVVNESVYVGSNSAITHYFNSSSKAYAVALRTVTAEIASGGRIVVDQKGFGPQLGTAAGTGTAVGGSHGGLGGRQLSEVTYGNYAAPDTLGSGGFGTSVGGRGGGAIRLIVSGTLTLNGELTATSDHAEPREMV